MGRRFIFGLLDFDCLRFLNLDSQIFFRPSRSDSEMGKSVEYVLYTADVWDFSKWAFMLYFHTALDVEGHNGQMTGTFVQGEWVASFAAERYENGIRFGHRDVRKSICWDDPTPFPLLKKNTQRGAGQKQRPQSSRDGSSELSYNRCAPICESRSWILRRFHENDGRQGLRTNFTVCLNEPSTSGCCYPASKIDFAAIFSKFF